MGFSKNCHRKFKKSKIKLCLIGKHLKNDSLSQFKTISQVDNAKSKIITQQSTETNPNMHTKYLPDLKIKTQNTYYQRF